MTIMQIRFHVMSFSLISHGVCPLFVFKTVIEASILLVSVSIVKDTVLSKSSIIMISLAFLHPSLSGNVLKSTDMLNKLPVVHPKNISSIGLDTARC